MKSSGEQPRIPLQPRNAFDYGFLSLQLPFVSIPYKPEIVCIYLESIYKSTTLQTATPYKPPPRICRLGIQLLYYNSINLNAKIIQKSAFNCSPPQHSYRALDTAVLASDRDLSVALVLNPLIQSYPLHP